MMKKPLLVSLAAAALLTGANVQAASMFDRMTEMETELKSLQMQLEEVKSAKAEVAEEEAVEADEEEASEDDEEESDEDEDEGDAEESDEEESDEENVVDGKDVIDEVIDNGE